MTDINDTFTAFIGTSESTVTGDYCDVMVTNEDGVGSPEFWADLPVRVDDPDEPIKVTAAADQALEAAGWERVSDWEYETDGLHATVVRATDEDEDTEPIVLINANPGDEVPGVEISQLDDDKLSFLTREDVEGFLADCGYGPDQPNELVYAYPAGEYTPPYGFPVQRFNVPASEAQAVRDAIRNA